MLWLTIISLFLSSFAIIFAWRISRYYSKKQEFRHTDGAILTALLSEKEKWTEELKSKMLEFFGKIQEVASPEHKQNLDTMIKDLSDSLSNTIFDFVYTTVESAIKLGGSAPTSYTPFVQPMSKSVITEEGRSLSDGTKDFYKK